MTPLRPVVVARGLARTFPGIPPVEALKPLDVTIEVGEYVSIAGGSGSGKSTLLHVLGLLDRPTDGTYELDGVDTASLHDAERAAIRGRRIGFVFQSFHLLPHRSVVENVVLAMTYNRTPRADRIERATTALETVGLGHRLDFLPTHLSGGEQQRVAIARAVATRPTLLLADEPTGNLDTTSSEAILDVFDAVHDAGQTLVVVTHDDVVSRRADRRLTLRDGALVADQRTSEMAR
jgi:putative ABC transport system ATP-binding protein